MSIEFRSPVRENAPLLIGISSGSGGGKTFSACLLARGLAGGEPFALIDTENGRALHYAEYFPDMRHHRLDAPYSPERYAEAIKAADDAGFPVIIVDSASHEYEGEGGVLRMQEAEFKRLGNREATKMLSWVAPKTAHKAFVRQLLQVKAHVILNMRAEDKVEMVKVDGETVVRAKQSLTSAEGWIPIMERRLPFELTMHLLLTADKPGFPKPVKLQEQHKEMVPLDQPLSEETGKLLGAWAAGGTASAGDPQAAQLGVAVSDARTGEAAQPSPAESLIATPAQKKKLDVLVGQLRDQQGLISTSQLWRSTHREPVASEDGEFHWSPLREMLSKDEASALIERLQKYADEKAVAGVAT